MINKAYALTFEGIYGPGGYALWADDVLGSTLENFFSNLLGLLTIIGGLAFLIYFVLGAFAWLSAHGNPENVAKAQRYISNALIGLILLVAAWAIIGIFGTILGFSLLDLAPRLEQIKP